MKLILKVSLLIGLLISIFLFGSSSLENDLIEGEMPLYGNWKTFTKKDGLPSDKVFCVSVDGDRIWAGTDAGLALLKDDRWQIFTTANGLSHNGVLSIDVSQETGDVWIATLSGLTRYSGGKFDIFTQFNSGLANDVIYTVECDGKDVWVATGGGASVYDTRTRTWKIYTQENAPMHEPWTYGVTASEGKIYIAAWGGGVIEYNKETGQFRDYVDPDGEMEIDLFPDDGLVHDITTGVTFGNNILWVGTYFGLSRYDGARWQGFFDTDSGLASNFINYLKADGSVVWLCTDKGLSSFNGDTWVTYRSEDNSYGGKIEIRKGDELKTIAATVSIAHNFVLGLDYRENEIWVATAKGLSKGEKLGPAPVLTSRK